MLTSLMRLTGVDEDLATVRLKVNKKAKELVRFSVRAVVVAGLSAAAGACVLLAFLVALTALYLWAEQAYGRFSALGIVGGISAVAALALWCAALVARPQRPDIVDPAVAVEKPEGFRVLPRMGRVTIPFLPWVLQCAANQIRNPCRKIRKE